MLLAVILRGRNINQLPPSRRRPPPSRTCNCHSSAYEIAPGSAKRIGLSTAKRIRIGSAKRIAWMQWVHWTGVPVSGEIVAMTAKKRTDMHRLQELVRLHRLGTGVREVARLLRMGPNTERQYRLALAQAGLLAGDAAELPSREANYFDRNRDTVEYAKYREHGWSTASSEIESAHRHVVQCRLKIAGAWWRPDTVDDVLALRMLKANGWWDEYWRTQRSAWKSRAHSPPRHYDANDAQAA